MISQTRVRSSSQESLSNESNEQNSESSSLPSFDDTTVYSDSENGSLRNSANFENGYMFEESFGFIY